MKLEKEPNREETSVEIRLFNQRVVYFFSVLNWMGFPLFANKIFASINEAKVHTIVVN